MAILNAIRQAAARACTALAVTSLFLMMLMTFFDVILRSTINQPIEAATELTRILMAVVVYSILPLVSAEGGHITVDLVDQFVPDWFRRFGDSLLAIVCGVMLFWPASRCIVLANRAHEYGDVTEYLAIPTYYIAWFITISVFVTAVSLIVRGLLGLFGKLALPESDRPASAAQTNYD